MVTAAVAVRRQADERKDVISIKGFLREPTPAPRWFDSVKGRALMYGLALVLLEEKTRNGI